jgi:hypothetical protein
VIEPGVETLAVDTCPDCAAHQFRRGPAGGMSVNIECCQCGSRFNVAVYTGRLISAERIAYNGEWPDRGFWDGVSGALSGPSADP